MNAQILDSFYEGIIVINNIGKIIYTNKAFCELSKYAFSSLKGKMFYPLLFNSENYSCQIKHSSYHSKLIASDGSLIPAKIFSYPLNLGNKGNLVICQIKNLSHIHKNQNEITLREQILESIFYASQQFLFSNNWSENIHQVLEHLGNSVQACKIRLFENSLENGEELTMKLHDQWINSIIKQTIEKTHDIISYFPLYEFIFYELSRGNIYYVDRDEKNLMLKHFNTNGSEVLIPIFVKD